MTEYLDKDTIVLVPLEREWEFPVRTVKVCRRAATRTLTCPDSAVVQRNLLAICPTAVKSTSSL